MRIFEPHAHMTSRTTDDYEAMAGVGVKAMVEPAFWLGQPRTSAGSFVDYFNSLLGWERFRAAQFGIRHHCTIGLNPKEANDPALSSEVLALLPRFLAKDGVVAVGEVGFDAMTPAEEEVLVTQLGMAGEHELPVLVHTPHRDKLAGTRRTLELVERSGLDPERVLIDHNNELTVEETLASGCWVGFSIYPNTKMDEYRMVRILERHGTDRMLINSACDWGVSDPLKVAKTVDAMRAGGFDEEDVDRVVWRNPVEFFGQSGRLILDELGERDLAATFEGNTVLRGERDRVPAPEPERVR
jgi:predicted metal-dependent TIM-barrel fold hydrolase